MRKGDQDPNKRYFRSSDRFIRLNGDWYFATRDGDQGPYLDECAARVDLKRHIASQVELKLFQQNRELWAAKQKAKLKPRKVTSEGLFSFDMLVD